MDIKLSSALYGTYGQNRSGSVSGGNAQSAPASAPRADDAISIRSDIVAISTSRPATRLVSESIEQIGGGYRRSQLFEKEDGRTFSRLEEVTLTSAGARRTVVQQNPSGNITRYEEALDREPEGNFRRVQRFQDESGDISTQISSNVRVTDPFILTGGAYPYPSASSSSPPLARGSRLDLRA